MLDSQGKLHTQGSTRKIQPIGTFQQQKTQKQLIQVGAIIENYQQSGSSLALPKISPYEPSSHDNDDYNRSNNPSIQPSSSSEIYRTSSHSTQSSHHPQSTTSKQPSSSHLLPSVSKRGSGLNNVQSNNSTTISTTTTTTTTPITTSSIKSTRPPLDIICILDTSGSMGSDNKLQNLKFAVNYIRGELNEFDRLSIVTFEDSAVGIHNLLRMTDENKSYSASLCEKLRPGGGTTILSGLEAVRTILETRTTANPITSVFLLTDGQDGSSVQEKKTTAQLIKSSGASLFVYGFGADHDSKHLQMIAEAANGTFTYIEKSDTVIDAFGGAIGAEQSIFARNICLTINSNNGCMITSTESGSYQHELDKSGSNTKVYFNNILLGEERDILLSLAIPSVSITNQINQLILSTNVSYSLIGSSQSSNILGSDCNIRRFPLNEISNLSKERNEAVDVQINRIRLINATKQSLQYADNGNYTEAKKVVEDTIKEMQDSTSMKKNNMKTKAFVNELNITLTNVRSSDIYQSKGGRAMLSQQQQDYGLQRQAYARDGTEGVYQNAFAKSSQMKAKNLKSSY
mmetsp:Transcript_9083/g.9607  ORF Transcript_9083/g.9607 Transcript_9083/m.9607 type:complete len:572 (+) Transcript_9083:458-2173(+)